MGLSMTADLRKKRQTLLSSHFCKFCDQMGEYQYFNSTAVMQRYIPSVSMAFQEIKK